MRRAFNLKPIHEQPTDIQTAALFFFEKLSIFLSISSVLCLKVCEIHNLFLLCLIPRKRNK